MLYFAPSVKTGDGVKEAFEYILYPALDHLYSRERVVEGEFRFRDPRVDEPSITKHKCSC